MGGENDNIQGSMTYVFRGEKINGSKIITKYYIKQLKKGDGIAIEFEK